MGRKFATYVLIPAVLLSAIGLAALSYRYSNALAERERQATLDTLRELAEEKVLNIEADLIQADEAVFDAFATDKLLDLRRVVQAQGPIESVRVFDERWDVIPGGAYDRRRSQPAQKRFRELLATKVIPDLRALDPPVGVRVSLHRAYDNRYYLFSLMKKREPRGVFYVVVESNLTYLVGTVFPQFFAGTRSPRVYQVVDPKGDVHYGYAFSGVPGRQVVELGFPETLTDWTVRVAQRSRSLDAAADSRRIADMVLIGMAVSTIVAGLAVLLLAARRERRANELKSEFISNVSHELKTPLSIISMFGEMLAMGRTAAPAQSAEYARIIMREATRLSRLIDTVLDFSKIESGADVYQFAPGDFPSLVDKCLDICRHRLERDDMELELQVEGDVPPAHMDENAMTLAVLNLLDNAIKYGAEGKRLDVTVRARDGVVAMTVRDYGPGIPLAERKEVFERFYRSPAARQLKRVRGSGIGLALVKHIAESHRGSVVIDDTDRGASFTLSIPQSKLRE